MECRGEPATVLPSQRMVGAELGEDRHHDAAHQVAPIGIVGLGEDLLKAFEGRLGVAGVPGREAPRQRSRPARRAVPELDGQPRPGGQALGLEVAVSVLEKLQRLGSLAARQQDMPSFGRGGVAGIELERLAQ